MPDSPTFFITSSGTEIGKTFVTALLIRQLRAQGHAVAALKPIVSGIAEENWRQSDPAILLEALGGPVTRERLAHLSPWQFAAPLSPDMAAAREGRDIVLADLVEFCVKARADAPGILMIEGVGGLMAPINQTATVRDWLTALAARIDIAPLLVIGSYLGTMSHTLTALEALHARDLKPRALIMSESEASPVPPEETIDSLRRFMGAIPILTVPRLDPDAAPPDLVPSLLGRTETKAAGPAPATG